ncbi:Rab5-interacting protein-domain-containing protein [Globomyces pollinis-pini]|nr:Rab5-interacting protein-domain-containing protein [Globomyces pollinis-pini]
MTSNEQTLDPVLSMDLIKHNLKVMNRIRSKSAVVCGLAAGILGLENLNGFLFYLICCLKLSFLFLIKSQFQVDKFLPAWDMIVTYEMFSNLPSFVLFWVFAYGICHIY